MPRPMIDLSGKKIDKLTVIEPTTSKVQGSFIYNCLCDCGRKVTKSRQNLKAGMNGKWRMHCGCLGRGGNRGVTQCVSNAIPTPIPINTEKSVEKSLNHLYLNYKNGAKARKYDWELDKSEFSKITKMNCHYCGIEPSSHHRIQEHHPYTYNGIDRKDNSKGYVKGNCLPCCGTCNRMKSTHSTRDFLAQIKKIHKHLKLT